MWDILIFFIDKPFSSEYSIFSKLNKKKLFLYFNLSSISFIFILSPFKALFIKFSNSPSRKDLELSLFSIFFTAYSINLFIKSFRFLINNFSASFSFMSNNSNSTFIPDKSIPKFSVSFGIRINIF